MHKQDEVVKLGAQLVEGPRPTSTGQEGDLAVDRQVKEAVHCMFVVCGIFENEALALVRVFCHVAVEDATTALGTKPAQEPVAGA